MNTEPKKGIAQDGREMHYSAGIIIECDGKYLLLDRLHPPPGFAAPAGHVDEGEEPRDAAVRELFEETGIVVADPEFLLEEEVPWNYCRSAQAHYWHLYRASVPTQEVTIQEDEVKGCGWYAPEEMRKLSLEEVWRHWFQKLGII